MNNRLLHTPEGVRDIYGKEYARKLAVEQKLQKAIHCFGYEDIQTPSIEFFDVFSKEIGTTPSKELYKFFDKEGNTLVLRPDFTPSIARCAAKYFMEEKVPLRFSYNGNTFTNTSNLQGKLKEVTQMGAELIGDPSVEADAEVISMVIEALKSTGLTRFQVTIGEVDYFRGLCEEAGLDEDTEKELRSCISGKNFFAAQELLEQKQIPEPYHSILLKLADMFENIESLEDAKALVKNERSLQAIARLEKLKKRLEQYGVAEYITFDLGMLSKYQYYTGVVFKAYTYGIGDAVVKGGRYDNLLRKFGKDTAAIGFVIVIDDENFKKRKLNSKQVNWLLENIEITLLKVVRDNDISYDDTSLAGLSEDSTLENYEQIALELCEKNKQPENDNQLIVRIQAYIDENYGDPSLCLSRISDLFHISESYFSFLFKKTVGVNFSTYLEQIRMTQAKHLLETTNIKITDLYVAVGYNNLTSFRRAFKKKYGVAPNALRE